MRSLFFFLILGLSSTLDITAQNPVKFHNVTSLLNDSLDAEKVVSLLKNVLDKKIILVSEERHRIPNIEYVRSELIKAINHRIGGADHIFYEWPSADFYMHSYFSSNPDKFQGLVKYHSEIRNNRFSFADSDYDEYGRNQKHFTDDLLVRNFGKIKVKPIDIGTWQSNMTVTYLAYSTKLINTLRIKEIDRFCDSMALHHKEKFNVLLFTAITDQDAELFLKNYEVFKVKILDNYHSHDAQRLLTLWDALIQEYRYKYFESQNFLEFRNTKSLRDFTVHLNFRDSVMMQTIQSQVSDCSSKPIIIAVSSLHAMRNYQVNVFESVISPQYINLGTRLATKFKDSVFSIAIMCSNYLTPDCVANIKNKKKTNKSLSNISKYLYSLLISDEGNYNTFFSLRPTFYEEYKANWLNMYDAILIIKNCRC